MWQYRYPFEMSHSKRHDYLVLNDVSASSDARRSSEECLISRESLGAARTLLDCIDMRASYRLEKSSQEYSNIMAFRQSAPKLPSLTHQERAAKPLDHSDFAPAQLLQDRHSICLFGDCAIRSHPDDSAHDVDKKSVHEMPGVFFVKETMLDLATCIVMKAPIKFERFISNVCDIMQHAQPGACNDFATARLSLLDLEFSRYRYQITSSKPGNMMSRFNQCFAASNRASKSGISKSTKLIEIFETCARWIHICITALA
jgi:hypothetical protein